MHIQESGEMYLETILILSKKSNSIHAIEVAEYMNYSKPSVSRALGILKNNGYLEVNAEGHLFLTEKGKAVAEKIYERHTLLKSLLLKLGVDEDTATTDACKIEHDISDVTFSAIKNHVSKQN